MLLILVVQELASACFKHLLELLGSLLSFAIFAFSFLSGVSLAFSFVLSLIEWILFLHFSSVVCASLTLIGARSCTFALNLHLG